MAQVTSRSVANGSGAAVRSDINSKLAALFVRNAANTAWDGLFSGSAAEVRSALGLVIGTNVQPFDANILKGNAAAVLTAAVTATPEDAGTKASGSFTPSPVGGNFKKYINGGAVRT